MSIELCSSTPNISSSEISPQDYLFEDIDLHRVTADCDTENTGSWKTLEKLGFWREAQFVESFPVYGGVRERMSLRAFTAGVARTDRAGECLLRPGNRRHGRSVRSNRRA